jgi:hypothetical protein
VRCPALALGYSLSPFPGFGLAAREFLNFCVHRCVSAVEMSATLPLIFFPVVAEWGQSVSSFLKFVD